MMARRLTKLISTQEGEFIERQPRSTELTERGRDSMPAGVPTSRHSTMPQPFWVDEGRGSRIRDVDGNEYVDLHGGHGAMLVGHAHPAIIAAGVDRLSRGTHFGQPVEDAVTVSAELARRFDLPLWRFTSSGTEATHDAVRLMREFTGRRYLVKIEGGYHGHHDSVLVSTSNQREELGPVERPASPRSGAGILEEIARFTLVVPWNDSAIIERLFREHPDDIAGVIVEPVLMNFGLVPPADGYLEALREITLAHGALLAYDEVKSGLTIGPGGAVRRYGVTPDLVCLAKAFSGGIATGAIGGSREVMELIASGRYLQVGTFNGNPLQLAMTRAALLEALTPDAYEHAVALNRRLADGMRATLDETGFGGYVGTLGAKGMLTLSPSRIATYRDFLDVDQRLAYLHWLVQHNGGAFLPPWAAGQPWLVSVQHTETDIDIVVANFARFTRLISEAGIGTADRTRK